MSNNKRFRILKKEEENGLGEIESSYTIQRKLLWWWKNVTFPFYYTANSYKQNKLMTIAVIHQMSIVFSTETKAREFLEKAKNPFSEIYKGQVIGVAFERGTLEEMYINYSLSEKGYVELGYEYDPTLKGLKNRIDKRLKIRKTIALS